MRTWNELWIKHWGRISIDEIIPWDVIELDYPTGNRRFIVKKVEENYIHIDAKDIISKDNPNIVWVIRGYPEDDEMIELVKENRFYIDVPDTTRDITPVFVSDMIRRFKPDIPYAFITLYSNSIFDKYCLHCNWYSFNKRWILWDSLKFYSIWEKVSYFI